MNVFPFNFSTNLSLFSFRGCKSTNSFLILQIFFKKNTFFSQKISLLQSCYFTSSKNGGQRYILFLYTPNYFYFFLQSISVLRNAAILELPQNNAHKLNETVIFKYIYPLIHMEYNTQLDRLIIPEYGRNIQGMIEYCCTIEDRAERNICARAIIQIMGQLNPPLRDVADFNHKLWDHLFIISQFKLDVDSPYPMPNAEKLAEKPKLLEYPKGRIRYKHYGKTIEEIIKKAARFPKALKGMNLPGK